MAGCDKTQLLATLSVYLRSLCPISLVTKLPKVVIDQHVHLILNLVFFILRLFEGQSLQQYPPNRRRIKENIRRETANIPAEQLDRVNGNFFHGARNVYM
jgi:hypothetical protein